MRKILRLSIQCYYRQSRLKAYRLHWFPLVITRCFFIFFIQLILFVIVFSIFICHSNQCCFHSSNIIVSLTTIPARFHYELPYAIHSLLSQTQLPKQIRIYLSPTSIIVKQKNLTLTHLKMYIQRLDSSKNILRLFDKLVQIQLEKEDYGPATKFLPIIKEFHSMKTNETKSQVIMICDDDHYYHSQTVATLNEYSTRYQNSIIGLRGWRIRQDLIWSVRGLEIDYHIIHSHHLSQMYHVGIITANSGYIIRPSFFDSHIYFDFNQAPNDVRHVDDIWLNGQASKRNVTRYVVPSCCPHIGVTQTHALEEYFEKHKMYRYLANTNALQWFNQSWEKNLWYQFNGKNGPKYRNWWTIIYRTWIFTIEWLKFVMNFGFIYV